MIGRVSQKMKPKKMGSREKIKRSLVVGLIFTLIFLLVPDYAQVNAVASSADGWTRLSDPLAVGGVITHLVAAPSNPDILYALQKMPIFSSPVSMHLYRSQDGGASWQIVPMGNQVFEFIGGGSGEPQYIVCCQWSAMEVYRCWLELVPALPIWRRGTRSRSRPHLPDRNHYKLG